MLGYQHSNTKRILTHLSAVLLLAVAWMLPASAPGADPGSLRRGPTVRVAEVGYAASFDLTDGQRVRLLGIRAPKPDTPAFAKQSEPLGAEAKTFVEDFLRDHSLTLYFDASPRDRYGRLLAHAVRDDGRWLQRDLLEKGLARVYTLPDNRALIPELLAAEAHARTQRRGLWALPDYAVASPETVRTGGFAIVEGKVLNQSRGGGPVYLNFGKTWKTDFTVRIERADRPRFSGEGDMPNYAGKRVRVRGWVFDRDGPMIDATHPEQIEILGP
jgi:endonuclease YncB( thermonuclease family)